MIAQANAATVLGIEAHPITVEVDVAIGLSAFNIVGLLDNTIFFFTSDVRHIRLARL